MIRQPRRSPLFPYTALSQSTDRRWKRTLQADHRRLASTAPRGAARKAYSGTCRAEDRKSTRLNSSHGYISYAVFCLKKKKPRQESAALQPLVFFVKSTSCAV